MIVFGFIIIIFLFSFLISYLFVSGKASRIETRSIVRRHINWNTHGPDLREDLALLVDNTKRRVCGIASAGFSLFSV